MYENVFNLTNLSLWVMSLFSGLGIVFFYFDCIRREKRLPLATKHADLDMRCKLKEQEYETLVQEIDKLKAAKAESEFLKASNLREQERLDYNKAELQKIEADRQAQEVLRQEIVHLQDKITHQNETLGTAQEAIAKLQGEKIYIEGKIQEFEQKNLHIQKELAQTQNDLETKKKVSEMLDCEISDKRSKAEYLENSINKLNLEKNELESNVETQRQLSLKIGQLESQCSDLNIKIQELETQKNSLEETRMELQEEILSLRKLSEDTQTKVTKISLEKKEIEKKCDSIKEEKERLEAHRNVLKNECDQYQKIINDREAALKEKNAKEACFDPLEDLTKPYFIEKKKSSINDLSEKEALKNLKDNLTQANLKYADRLLYSFHTSLKINDISPLVVLSGISGTGKSQLPQQYAAAMGINYLNMAVQPRWDSPQDIFGFYNFMEGRYKATELTRALIQAERYNRADWSSLKFTKDYPQLNDQMTLVLFDEMNLARVEYYFSEFLSKLEVRRGLNVLKPEERQKAEISLDVGRIQSNNKELRLYVDSNVLFVGTMNEDESTQTLSDKILDRANMLRFGKPKELMPKKINTENISNSYALSFDNWNAWIKNSDKLPDNVINLQKERIDRLNRAMEKLGRPFGHRVCQSMLSYIANYPDLPGEKHFDYAFADQLEQRILPKLRNIDCRSATEPLDEICKLIDEVNDVNLSTAFKEAQERDFFDWKGVERE